MSTRETIARIGSIRRQRAGRSPPDVTVAGSRVFGLVQAPWRALCPDHVVELRDPDLLTLRRLPSGTAVALVSDALFGRARLRRRARLAGIRIERELIVVPDTRSPLVVVDDVESAVRHLWSSVAAVPPGLTWTAAPAGVALSLMQWMPWRLTGAVVPGRVLLGCRK